MNKKMFASSPSLVVATDTVNNAGGAAYALSPEQVLATIACTSFFGDTFYTKAEDHLDQILDAARKCDDTFVAQVAVYAREHGFMKDTPAVLCAYLFGKRALTAATFNAVIDNVKMLSNFVRCVRSGQFGRRSLGSVGKRLVQNWLARRPVDYLWRQSIAKDPSLADIIKLSRPRPVSHAFDAPAPVLDRERAALYRHLIGKDVEHEQLPLLVRETLAFLKEPAGKVVPDVPFNMVDAVPLNTDQWKQLFREGGYQFTRMNIATALRQGVLKDKELVRIISTRLADKAEVLKARQFPYQMLQALGAVHAEVDVPMEIKVALHLAMEHATANVPVLDGNVWIAVDSSGSMGGRLTLTSPVCYSDIAGLFAAAIVRKNMNANVIAFDTMARIVPVNPMDSCATVAASLARAGGGTNCAAPIELLAREKRKVDLLVLISDNESWVDHGFVVGRQTGSVAAWNELKKINPDAKQVRINISPNGTDQLPHRADTLRVAGFSDAVFTAVARWQQGEDWVACIRNAAR